MTRRIFRHVRVTRLLLRNQPSLVDAIDKRRRFLSNAKIISSNLSPVLPPVLKNHHQPVDQPYLSLKVNEENEVDNNLQNHSDLLIQLTQNHTFLVLKSTAQNNWTRKTTYCNLKLAISFTHLTNSSTNKKLKTFFFFEQTYSFDSTSIL